MESVELRNSEQQCGPNSWFVGSSKKERQGQPALVPMKRAALSELHVTFDSTRATELICTSSYGLTSTDVVFMLQGYPKESKFTGGGIP